MIGYLREQDAPSGLATVSSTKKLFPWKPYNTVKPPVAATARDQPPLLSDQFSKVPKLSHSNHYIWNILQASTSHM